MFKERDHRRVLATPATTGPRVRIVKLARQRFLTHGFRGVTMDDLASELGMSKKTLYAHFSGKRALLEAVIEDKLLEAEGELERITEASGADFSETLLRLLRCVQKHAEELHPAFLRDMSRETPDLFTKVQARRRVVFQRYFGNLLREGSKEGLIRKDITVDLMIEILIGATDSLVNPEKLSQLGLSANTCLSSIIRIFLEGVVTNK